MTSQRNVEPDDSGPDQVLAAARHVVMTHGPRRTTLAEVARQAGVSRMTVYRRFESLDRLMSELLTAELAQLVKERLQPVPTGTAGEQAAALISGLTLGIAEHPLVVRVLQVDPESLTPLMVSRFGQTQRSAVEILVPLLSAGMAERGGDGSIRSTDPQALAQAIVVAAQGFIFGAQAIAGLPNSDDVWREWPRMVAGMLQPQGDDR